MLATRKPYEQLSLDSLEYVTREPNGMNWYYDSELQKYVRFNGNDFSMWISGKYVPDPFILWDNRIKMGGHKDRVRPEDTTFDLYAHWQKVSA